jgi:hypothetical protein
MATEQTEDLIDILGLNHYTEGNDFTGSMTHNRQRKLLIRFRIVPDLESSKLKVYCWRSDVCFEKARDLEEATFPLTEAGLDQVRQWVCQNYQQLDSQI